MKFTEILPVNPDQYKLSSSRSPRKLLLESYSKEYPKKDNISENKISEDETAISIGAEEKLALIV